ncbi:MAG: hypothetical protein DIU79_16690 [Actinobacteria bacterium]|nr:MAG: hypothetical protein DIU79_16690 [Actinomycetota bacterium]
MSVSTPGGTQRPSSDESTAKRGAAGAKPAAGKAPGTRSGAGQTSGRRPAGKGPGSKGKGRKPVTPVKVSQGPAWGPIALFTAVGMLAVGIIGYGAYAVIEGTKSWQERAAEIPGIINVRETDPKHLEYERHLPGKIEYTKYIPPVGGVHNNAWQNCMGDVYDAPIANEHAVHSLEHGAVWITYRPDLPKDQVEKLAERVRGKEKMMMSPYEGLDAPISLQAWGYQLKVDHADDKRIDDFIKALRVNASIEGPNALCANGVTETGTTPRDDAAGHAELVNP